MYTPLNTRNQWLSDSTAEAKFKQSVFLGHPNTRLSVIEASFEHLRIHENPPLFVFNMKDKTRTKEKEGSKSQGTQKKDHKVTRPQEEGLG